MKLLQGKRALIVGVANERSLAWAIAEQLHQQGAELAFTYQGESLERRVRPLAESVGSSFIQPCDVASDESILNLKKQLTEKWNSLDILIHSVAFADKQDLEGRFVDTTRDGFKKAMDISAYSLVALSQAFEPLLSQSESASIVTLSYYGAVKVIPNYNVMGVAKAALEASVRYLANDLGAQRIRVNAISAGPVKTLAAAGIKGFKEMLSQAGDKTPMKQNISKEDVGSLGAFLCGPGSKMITGSTIYVDRGAHILGSV